MLGGNSRVPFALDLVFPAAVAQLCVRPLTMRSILLGFLPYVILTGLLLLAAPVISRIGSKQTMRTWSSAPGALGVSRPLTLSFERHVADVDVLGGYPTYRLLITDGGYGYVHDFQIPSADAKRFVQGCRVVWDTNKVEFIMPDGETLTFPAQVVTRQTGP
jgi:hypothetical protein